MIETLWPTKRTIAGSTAVTDGLALFRLLLRRPSAGFAAAYAGRLRPYLSAASTAPLPSRHAREIMFQTTRFDRWTEAWARCDAVEHLEALLVQSDLVGAERACVATAIVSVALAFGDGTVSPERIDAMSRDTFASCSAPGPMALRGVVLAFNGDLHAGHELLEAAQQEFQDRRGQACLEWILCLAALGHIAAMRARSLSQAPELAALSERAAAGWFGTARRLAAVLNRNAPSLIDRFDPPAIAYDRPGHTALRWLRGVERLKAFQAAEPTSF